MIFGLAILMGIIEGLTEFIPVSSTGHLILLGDLINFELENQETFDISIQLGAILAVVVEYRHFFWETFHPRGWFSKNFNKIVVATLPILASGFLFYGFIKSTLFSPFTVAIGLGIGGMVMISVEKLIRPKPTTDTIQAMSIKQALLIGCFQIAALWPGMSRSGATIVGGLLTGCSYSLAARFSFIVAVPVMIIAVGYDLFKTAHALSVLDIQLIGVGFGVSFLVAWGAIRTFLKLLTRFKLTPFAIYRLLIAALILI